jgi:hypothetical protein
LEVSGLPPDLIAFLIIVLLLCVAYQFGMRCVLSYRLTDEDVRAVLFGVVPVSVRKYRFITEVHTTTFFEGEFITLAWRVPNKLITGRGVMIFSKGSLFWGAVLYTPDDPEGLARELRRRVYQQTGRLPLGS